MVLHSQVSLKQYNTFGIDVIAQHLLSFTTVEELKEALHLSQSSTRLILGGGSNVLFTQNVQGYVLKNELKGISLTAEDEHYVYVRANAGENWHSFVMYCIKNGFAGLENLSLIPGNVGASPMQNIGAYGVEIKDLFHSLEAFHIQDNVMVNFNLDDCRFGYRESVFKRELRDQYVITSVTYRLNKVPEFNISYGAIKQELDNMRVQQLSIAAISQAVINIRSSKLPNPTDIGNAGSFFKNPTIPIEQLNQLQKEFPNIPNYPAPSTAGDHTLVKIAAGWLIEQCGWKGYRNGDAGCHSKQALVLVNYGNATGEEIYTLSQQIIDSVRARFNILLEREVNIY